MHLVWRRGQEVTDPVAYIYSWPHVSLLSACISGCSIWPRAVIGHTDPRSHCLAADACGETAQALGLINLWDCRDGPKMFSPLSSFAMTSLPHKYPLYHIRDSVQGSYIRMSITHYRFFVCVIDIKRVSSHALILIFWPCRRCDYVCPHYLAVFCCLSWPLFTGFKAR